MSSDFKQEMDRIATLFRTTEDLLNSVEIKVDFDLNSVGQTISLTKINGRFRLCLNGTPASDLAVLDKIWVAEHLEEFVTAYQAYLHKVAERARRAGKKP